MGVDEYPLADLIIFITLAALIWKLGKQHSAYGKPLPMLIYMSIFIAPTFSQEKVGGWQMSCLIAH